VSLNTELYQTPEPLLAKLENAVNALLITTPPKKKKITNVTSVMLQIKVDQ
jgi:hypothetical protein